MNSLWKLRLERDFVAYPRYYRSIVQNNNGQQTTTTTTATPQESKRFYKRIRHDIRRTEIAVEDLEELNWFFNFHPNAGGRGKETLVKCVFRGNFLFLSGFLPLPYFLVEDGGTNAVKIANFPLHRVQRLKDGEWLVFNEHVTFVSCDEDGRLCYNERGFQD